MVNEFYALDGLKFSTSRRHAVWAGGLPGHRGPGAGPALLGWDRPAGFESDFTPAGYAASGTGPARCWPARRPRRCRRISAAAELARAAQALRLETFDPALATRCLLGALGGPADAQARTMLAALTGAGTVAARR